ncbi:UNVERIFIED_CONTAM: hypothetical protein FKN15_005946 [Acipenser sinensis]
MYMENRGDKNIYYKSLQRFGFCLLAKQGDENRSLDTVDKHSPVETEEREEAAQVSAVPDPLNGTADLQGKYHQKHFLYSLDNQVIAENGFDIFCYKTRVVFLLDVGENCILTVNVTLESFSQNL